MSQLIDILNRADKAAAQPMGFRTARQAPSAPRILLIASLEMGGGEPLAEHVEGADAVMLRPAKARLTEKTMQKMVALLPSIPWGIYLEGNGEKKVDKLAEAGCDYVVLPSGSRVSTAPQDDTTGKILEVDSSMDDSLLRAVNNLSVDAVLVADTFEGGGTLIWHQLMIFQHLASLITKPVLVPAPSDITDSELKALWNAGVDGVVVAVDTGKPGTLKELRQAISKLPPRSARKHGKAEALLPSVGGEPKEVTPDEEEEDEEYE